MFKPQQHRDQAPPVFGKPWFWHCSSSTMESSRGMARVIMEMRDEIHKLETENRALRGGEGGGQPGLGGSLAGEPCTVENPYSNLRRNASAPALEAKYQENTVMTVRRYSISSRSEGIGDGSRMRDSGWGRLQEEVKRGNGATIFGNSSRFEMGKLTNRHSLQEYVHKNRSKVKTVTFLLPVDDIYTNRPVLSKHQDEDRRTTELDSITETDS